MHFYGVQILLNNRNIMSVKISFALHEIQFILKLKEKAAVVLIIGRVKWIVEWAAIGQDARGGNKYFGCPSEVSDFTFRRCERIDR